MIYVLLADGFEEIEALTFTDMLRRSGIDVNLVSVDDIDIVRGSHNIKIVCDIKISDIDKNTIDGVVLPGGLPGTYNLKDNIAVKELLDYANENNIIMGAICAAPYVFEQFGYLKDVKVTVNPGFEDKMINCNLVDKRVCTDKNFITSQGPGTTHEFAKSFISHFRSEADALNLTNEMLYK